MRELIPNIALVSILSILVVRTHGRPTSCIPAVYAQSIEARSVDITKVCTADYIDPVEALALKQRAGGGGRPGDKTPDGPSRPGNTPGDGPGDDVPSDTNDGGGMGRHGGTTGGMGDRPDEPVPGRKEFEHSVRDNQNKPATESQPRLDPEAKKMDKINVGQVARDMKARIEAENIQGPWYFYSGFQNRDDAKPEVRDTLTKELGQKHKISSMEDAKGRLLEDERAKIERSNDFGEYFWQAHSKAYSQAVSGKVSVVISGEGPINQPYLEKGSNWWTFEVSELMRNEKISGNHTCETGHRDKPGRRSGYVYIDNR